MPPPSAPVSVPGVSVPGGREERVKMSRLRRRISPYGLALRTARGLGYYLERTAEAS